MTRRQSLRTKSCERLEPRICFDCSCSNPFNRFDVNDDGHVSAIDALVLLDQLQSQGARQLQEPQGSFVDVNSDSWLSAEDLLLVVNLLNNVALLGNAVPLVVSIDPLDDPNGNAVVHNTEISLIGFTEPLANVRIRRSDLTLVVTQADGNGAFRAEISLETGTNLLRFEAANLSGATQSQEHSVVLGDILLDWNATMLNIIRDWSTFSNDPYTNRIVSERPPMAARNLAIIHAAMFDSIASVSEHHEPLFVHGVVQPGASAEAAASTAAHILATWLYSSSREKNLLDATLAESLASITDQDARAKGILVGQSVAQAYIDWRKQDGSDMPVNYVASVTPGAWNRTFPDFLPPTLPNWPNVAPFAVASGSQFRPSPPPSIESPEYAAAVDEVLRMGNWDSAERTADQTEIAIFWADGAGTATPPGHWNQIAADLVSGTRRSLIENSRLFALLNIAMADAGIASWDAKYFYNLWRPIHAIRYGDSDGNDLTQTNPHWMPLLKTPPFPSYTSGHSTFSGAAATVLTALLGDVPFETSNDAHSGFRQKPLAPSQLKKRSFTSFWQAAEEAGASRIYGGIHFSFDNTAGLSMGTQIGNLVMQRFAAMQGDGEQAISF